MTAVAEIVLKGCSCVLLELMTTGKPYSGSCPFGIVELCDYACA